MKRGPCVVIRGGGRDAQPFFKTVSWGVAGKPRAGVTFGFRSGQVLCPSWEGLDDSSTGNDATEGINGGGMDS